jgi:hypothetical protein
MVMPLLSTTVNKSNNINNKNCSKCFHKHNIPFLYLYVFKLITDKVGMEDQMITAKQLLEFWHRNIYNVPRKYDIHILNEMCSMGLLEKINSQKYKFYGESASNKLKKLRDNFLW